MTEDEVNLKVKDWLIKKGYTYKGILNTGLGQVPVPDGIRQVLIDHQGFNDKTKDLIWIEAKGSDTNFSNLLEGYIRTCYAVWHGEGKGYLACPHIEYERLIEQLEFVKAVAKATDNIGSIGILDIETGEVTNL